MERENAQPYSMGGGGGIGKKSIKSVYRGSDGHLTIL